MNIHHHIFYRSDAQAHVRYVNGERKEEPYYLYYLFRPDGIWLCKTTEDPFLEIEDFLAQIDLAAIISDPHHDEPLDRRQELVYQSGTYIIRDETVFLTWKHNLLEEKERRWYFRILPSGILSTDFGEIELQPLH